MFLEINVAFNSATVPILSLSFPEKDNAMIKYLNLLLQWPSKI